MNDEAAHLLDRVLPFSPYRQWVLSLPFRLRLLLAKRADLLAAVRTVFVCSVRTWQRRQARPQGLRDAKTAAVCVTQRFGTRLDANPHFHCLVPDAVFVEDQEGAIELRRLPRPTIEDLGHIGERIARRTLALLQRELGEGPDPDALDRLRAAIQLTFPALARPSEDRAAKVEARCAGVYQGLLAEAIGASGELAEVDLSLGMLSACARRARISPLLVQANAARLPFPDSSFDAVFHFGGVKLFSDPTRALSEMVRVARPGAIVAWGDEGFGASVPRGWRTRLLARINPGFAEPQPPAPGAVHVEAQYEVMGGFAWLTVARKSAGG